MTTIRATCPTCGEVEMGATDVVLTVPAGATEGTYRFDCPTCAETVEKHADRKVVMLLLSAGVDVREVDGEGRPARAPARRSSIDGDAPPLTVDDLIDFHYLLEDEAWLEELARSDG